MKTAYKKVIGLILFGRRLSAAFQVLIVTVAVLSGTSCFAQGNNMLRVVFDGVKSEQRWSLQSLKDYLPAELGGQLPSDWSDANFLAIEMRTSSPQRFSLWLYTSDGKRRIMLQPFGQNVWLRASIPLQYFKGKDQRGNDLASTNNRRTDSFWMSVWGPFGDLKDIEAIGVVMEYPVNKPVLEIRSIKLSQEDPGSDFLEEKPVLDEFGQWAYADWPRKIKSAEQLEKELDEEKKSLGSGGFNYCEYGGYLNTKAKATGFFRVQQIDGKWWFVDPHGHLFLSTGSNGIRSGRGRRGGQRVEGVPPSNRGQDARDTYAAAEDLLNRRLDAWGMNTVGNWSASDQSRTKAYVTTFRGPRGGLSYLGMPDVYSQEFAGSIDSAAAQQCAPRRNDPWLIGYFMGNEPPWAGRESEVVDMFLNGAESATKDKLKEFLAQGDTPERRVEFVHGMFQKYLTLLAGAVKKYDPNHLNLGIRFGGTPPEPVLRMSSIFDVCSINVYEYEPTKQLKRVYEITGRPVLIGEFHIGVPADGLGAGLVQARDQIERAKGYRYYMEQAAALPCFLGAHWFTWQDEPVLGRMDGENYNIGFIDVTNRPYPELVEAAKQTHKRLFNVHAGKMEPFNQRPMASDAGTPASPWD
jgi:hypothetical protein